MLMVWPKLALAAFLVIAAMHARGHAQGLFPDAAGLPGRKKSVDRHWCCSPMNSAPCLLGALRPVCRTTCLDLYCPTGNDQFRRPGSPPVSWPCDTGPDPWPESLESFTFWPLKSRPGHIGGRLHRDPWAFAAGTRNKWGGAYQQILCPVGQSSGIRCPSRPGMVLTVGISGHCPGRRRRYGTRFCPGPAHRGQAFL